MGDTVPAVPATLDLNVVGWMSQKKKIEAGLKFTLGPSVISTYEGGSFSNCVVL